ncbi:MAG: hypothetical protein Q9P01_17410 [Anaerolineae bacterium]|nr:hypothetical protein [Anaerolineae bacterium]
MSDVAQLSEPLSASDNTRSLSSIVIRNLRHNPVVVIGLIVVIAWIGLSLLAPQIAPFSRLEQNVRDRLQPPKFRPLDGNR